MNDVAISSRIPHLLSLASTMRSYQSALARAQGENFNLFEILNVGHYEVHTHSPLLAELLNPKGAHEQGAELLRNFLQLLDIKNFDPEEASVDCEVPIGSMGRIDILITDRKRRHVIIENKINARLQDKQLERYHDFDPQASLLYLTLRGDPPPQNTNAQHVPNLKLVSYRTDIIRWLEACRKEAATVPAVRETITQYIHLIRRLTQQDTNSRMNNDLVKAVLHDETSYRAFAYLRDTNSAVRKQMILELNQKVLAGFNIGVAPSSTLEGEGGTEKYLFIPDSLRALNVGFAFEFEKPDYKSCFFGFKRLDQARPVACEPLLKEAFKAEFGQSPRSTPSWPAWEWWQVRDWTDDTLVKARFGNLHENIIVTLQSLKRVADQLTPGATLNPAA